MLVLVVCSWCVLVLVRGVLVLVVYTRDMIVVYVRVIVVYVRVIVVCVCVCVCVRVRVICSWCVRARGVVRVLVFVVCAREV